MRDDTRNTEICQEPRPARRMKKPIARCSSSPPTPTTPRHATSRHAQRAAGIRHPHPAPGTRVDARGGHRRPSSDSEPRAATGWLTAGLVLLCMALGLTVVAAGQGTVPGDIAVARALQLPVSPEIDAIARSASMVGDDFPSMVILASIGVALLAYLERRDLALFLGIAAAMRAIGPDLKVLVASPGRRSRRLWLSTEAGGRDSPAVTRWERRSSTARSRSSRRKSSRIVSSFVRFSGGRGDDDPDRALSGASRGALADGYRRWSALWSWPSSASCRRRCWPGEYPVRKVSEPRSRRASWRV